MKPTKYAGSIVMTIAGLVFLVPQLIKAINGQPVGFSPGVAAATGFFLCRCHRSLVPPEVRSPFSPAQCLTRGHRHAGRRQACSDPLPFRFRKRSHGKRRGAGHRTSDTHGQPAQQSSAGRSSPIASKSRWHGRGPEQFELVVKVAANASNGSSLTNTAIVISATSDPVSANNTSKFSVLVKV